MLNRFNKYLAQPFVWLIRFYQLTLSPDKGLPSLWLKGKVCLHHPHCSQYSISVLQRYGLVPGMYYAFSRIVSCNPMSVRRYPTFDGQKAYDPPFYKIVFFSGSPLGIPFLKYLNSDPRFEVSGVVSMPPKPVGRGQKVQLNIIASFAKELGIDNIQTPSKLTPKTFEGQQLKKWLKELAPDFFVVVAYGKIIPKSLLDIPRIAPINVHGSLLPAYRGASPLQEVFLDQQEQTGITIMKMNDKMDEGDVLDVLKVKIPFDRTVEDLIKWIEQYGPSFLADTLRDYAKGNVKATPQDHSKATYTSKIQKQDGEINPWHMPLNQVWAKYRAYKIWPGIWFVLDGDFVNKNLLVKIEYLKLDRDLFASHASQPLIVDKVEGELNPAVKTLKVKPAGKKTMDFEDFKRGYRFLQVV